MLGCPRASVRRRLSSQEAAPRSTYKYHRGVPRAEGMRIGSGPRQISVLSALAVVGAVGILTGLTLLSYPILRTGEIMRVAPPPTSVPASPCGRVNMTPGTSFTLKLDSLQSCDWGFPGWGVNLSFAWVTFGPPVTLTLGWGCYATLSCPMFEPDTIVYNHTGTFGSFTFYTGSLGSRWTGENWIHCSIAATEGATLGQPLPEGLVVNGGGAIGA